MLTLVCEVMGFMYEDWKITEVRLDTDEDSEFRLHELCYGDDLLSVSNPCKDFAVKMKSGGFCGDCDDYIVQQADIANTLADIWKIGSKELGEPSLNIFQLFTKLTEKYLLLVKENGELKDIVSQNEGAA